MDGATDTISVSVYLTRVADVGDSAAWARYRSLLSPSEVATYARFARAARQHEFLLGRALARHALSECHQLPPEAWSFRAAPEGRLEVDGPSRALADGAPQFNLTHSAGVVACAVAGRASVGIDVEAPDDRPILDLARRFFAPIEFTELMATPATLRQDRFLALWTLKEAYTKAIGLGLSVPLDSFWFLEPDSPAPAITFRASPADALAWRFARCRLTDGHHLAVAVHTACRPLRVSVRTCIPLLAGATRDLIVDTARLPSGLALS